MSEDLDYKPLLVVLSIIGIVGYVYFKQFSIDVIINSSVRILSSIFSLLSIFFLTFHLMKNNKYISPNKKISKLLVITLLLFLGLFSFLAIKSIDYYNLDVNVLIKTSYSILLNILPYLILSVIVLIIVRVIVKTKSKRKKEFLLFQTKLNNLRKENCSTISKINKIVIKLNELVESNIKFSDKFEDLIKQIRIKLKKSKQKIINQEKEKQIELENRLDKATNDLLKISILYDYFLEKDSAESIPKYAKNYTIQIIEKAQKQFGNHHYAIELEKEKLEEAEENEKRIINHILEIKGLPADYSKLPEKDQATYDKNLELFEKGELKPKIELSQEDEKLLEQDFFQANELTDEQKEILTKNFQYQYQPFFHLNGTLGNNLIIKNTSKTESNYHFCMKHLISKIDPENSIIEYTIKDMRADVVFTYNKKRIAVEVEKGTNNKKSIKKKIELLNKYFDYWIITCPKAELKNYNKYADKQKSFCLKSKQTQEKIQEFKQQLQQNNK